MSENILCAQNPQAEVVMPAIKRLEVYYNLMPTKINECNGQKKEEQTP